MMMKKEDREYAARVIEGIISDKQSKGCANSCIECSKDSKGCARDPGGFEWKYKGILEKAIELLRKPEPVNEKKELKEAKSLLKSAIDEWPFLCEWGDCGEHCEWFANGKCNQEWSNKTEALALIGKDGDTECQDTE